MNAVKEYWIPFINLSRSKEQKTIMFIVHGSEYIRDDSLLKTPGLKSQEIAEASGIKNIYYHLKKLKEDGLLQQTYIIKNGRGIILWRVTEKWMDFARDFKIDEKIKMYLQEN